MRSNFKIFISLSKLPLGVIVNTIHFCRSIAPRNQTPAHVHSMKSSKAIKKAFSMCFRVKTLSNIVQRYAIMSFVKYR